MRTESAVFTNLCLVTDAQGRILLQKRTDPNWPGYTCPGGHVEPEESFVAAAIREVEEETGLTMEDPALRGLKQFQLEGGIRYMVILFRASRWHGQLRGSAEGEVCWASREEMASMPLVPNLMEMIQVIESDNLTEFVYRPDGSPQLI